jgi:N-acetyl-anhydromuramyl-L-alanine amidase AmpD
MSINTHRLPDITWEPTDNKSSRQGAKVERVVLHTWGVHYTDEKAEKASYHGVINYFKQKSSQVSAHFVYPGSAEPGHIAQMVAYADMAWAEKSYNRTSVEIECADAIWLGHDAAGLEQLAHITGFLLHKFALKPKHEIFGGFCRHGDLGIAGGSHPVCPVKVPNAHWDHFMVLVKKHYDAGGYRAHWGR